MTRGDRRDAPADASTCPFPASESKQTVVCTSPDVAGRVFDQRGDLVSNQSVPGTVYVDIATANTRDQRLLAEPDLESPITGYEQCVHGAVRQRSARELVPRPEAHAVEAEEARIRPDPEEPVPVLRERPDGSGRQAIVFRP
jgi:hypothetical protein